MAVVEMSPFLRKKVIWYCFKNFSVIFLLFRKKGARKVLKYRPQDDDSAAKPDEVESQKSGREDSAHDEVGYPLVS